MEFQNGSFMLNGKRIARVFNYERTDDKLVFELVDVEEVTAPMFLNLLEVTYPKATLRETISERPPIGPDDKADAIKLLKAQKENIDNVLVNVDKPTNDGMLLYAQLSTELALKYAEVILS